MKDLKDKAKNDIDSDLFITKIFFLIIKTKVDKILKKVKKISHLWPLHVRRNRDKFSVIEIVAKEIVIFVVLSDATAATVDSCAVNVIVVEEFFEIFFRQRRRKVVGDFSVSGGCAVAEN